MFTKFFNKSEKGFTLIETIVAIVIVGIIGVVVSDLLVRSFKGSNKAQLLGNVKQNGQTALNVMDRTIRTASSVVCPANTGPGQVLKGNVLVVQDVDGNYVRFSIIPQSVSPARNGALIQDNPLVGITGYSALPAGYPAVCSAANYNASGRTFDSRCAAYLCESDFSNPINSSTKYLTNYDLTSGVSVIRGTTGTFSQYLPAAGQKNTVRIDFFISPSVTAGSTFDNQAATLPFSTTIELR